MDAREDAGEDDEHAVIGSKGGQRFSFTLPPPAAGATAQMHARAGLPPLRNDGQQPSSSSSSAQRRNQYLSLDFLPAASSPGAHSAPPSLLGSSGSPSPLMGTLTPSPLSAALSSSASSSGVGSSNSSLSLPPPIAAGSWNTHKSHSAGHSTGHSAGSSYSNSTNSSSSSSPKISASLTAHHHAAHGMRNSAPAGSAALLPRSPPPLSRPTSDPCFDGSSSAAIHAAAAAAPTVETFAVHTHYNSSGQKQINQYVVEGGEIGRGSYGTVKLVFNTQDQQYYAMKVMNKSLLKKRRVMGFTAGLTASASRTASMGAAGIAALRAGAAAGAAGAGAAAAAGVSSTAACVSSTAAVSAAHANIRAHSSGALSSGGGGLGGGSGSNSTDHWTNVQREIAIMKRLDHPSVVRLYEVMDDPSTDNLYLIVEYMERGALMSGELDKLRALPLDDCWRYFRDTVMGLEYLHFNHILHRDLKPENLLLGKNDRVKITDFGVSMLFEGDNDRILQNGTTVGSAAFLPPELCGGGLGIGGSAATGSGSRGIACVPPSPQRVLSSPVLAPSRHLLAPPPSALSPPPLHPAANQNQPTPALLAVLGGLSADNRSFSMPVGLPPPPSAATAASASSSGTVLPRSAAPHSHHARSNSDSLATPSEISGKKGDLWSLGITLYVMVFGRLPFMAKTVHLIYKAIVEEDLQVPPLPGPDGKDSNPNNVTMETQPDLIDLLHRMLDKNPHTRISLLEIKAHPWVTKRGAEPMEEQCDYEGTGGNGGAGAMPASAVEEESSSSGMMSNALQRRLDRAAKKQAQAHARAQSGSSSLGPALQEEEEEELTDTEDEREAEGQDRMGQGLCAPKDPASTDSFNAATRGRSATYGPTSSSGSAAAGAPRHRPSMSYQHITLTNEDMLGAVTLVSRVILVVKLKAKMKKARLNLASAVRARSASMGDVGNHPARVAALAAIQARAAAAKSPERKKPTTAFECLSPSLSRDTHISVPVGSLEASAAVHAPVHAKRRPIKPTSHLLAEARAAIVAGTAGQDAAQAWGAAHPRDGEESASPPATGLPATLFSPTSPASPQWKGAQGAGAAGGRMGRLGLFPSRRKSTPRTPSLQRSQTEPPATPGSSASPPASAAGAAAGSCAEDALLHSSPPASAQHDDDVSSPASAPEVLSPSCAPRHQSAPLRPPPALFVPYDTYLQTQPASLSCSHASASTTEEEAVLRSTRQHEVLVAKQRQREAEAAAAAAAAEAMEDEISRAAARKIEADAAIAAAARRRASDADANVSDASDFEDEAVEAVEPDQDLDI